MRETTRRYLRLRWLAAGIAVMPILPLMTGAAVVRDLLAKRGAPAPHAALRPDDRVRLDEGKPVQDSAQVPTVLAATPTGKKAPAAVLRGGKEEDLVVKIGRMPAEERP